MALNHRPIAPKSPKIKNTQLIQLYRSNHKQCEICALDGIYTHVDDIHHIIPGAGRSDVLWNLIALCRNHHIEATEHTNPLTAPKLNIMFLGLKYLKHEVSDKILHGLGIFDEVMLAQDSLSKRFEAYRKGEIL